MVDIDLAIAIFFLPLFPFSMVFTSLFHIARHRWLRAILLLVWPQIGVFALSMSSGQPPTWLIIWAMVSALFYAWRGLALREAGNWVAFVAVSAWPLLWAGTSFKGLVYFQALGISLPLAVMCLLIHAVERRFGAAHTRLDLRLAARAPRLAAVFALALLAAIAMPVSPGFFSLLAMVMDQAPASPPTALALLASWLLWTWSGARILQGMVAGARTHAPPNDISAGLTWAYAILFVALGLSGILLGVHLL